MILCGGFVRFSLRGGPMGLQRCHGTGGGEVLVPDGAAEAHYPGQKDE